MPNPILTLKTTLDLKRQKDIFEQTLVREILAEIQFLWNIRAGRAERRKGYSDKLVELFTALFSTAFSLAGAAAGPIAPAFALADSAVKLAGLGMQHRLDKQAKAGVGKLTDVLQATDLARLELYLKQFAKVAALRYEPLFANLLSVEPGKSVIPLAMLGARRVIDYLMRLSQGAKNVYKLQDQKQLPLIDLLLDGLIQGHSGRKKDGFFNHPLEGKGGNTNLTIEGALSRSAMRILPISSPSHTDLQSLPIYYRITSVHKHVGVDKDFAWGEVNLVDEKDPSKGTKYSYLWVDEATRQRYQYEQMLPPVVLQAPESQVYPTVYIATKADILAYQQYVAECTAKGVIPPSCYDYVQNKVAQETNNHRFITEVWVREVDFTNEVLTAGNYEGIDFNGCIFDGARLENVNLSGASLQFVSAINLKCHQVTFAHTQFEFANLTGAEFKEVNTLNTQWLGVRGLETIKLLATPAQPVKEAHQQESTYQKAIESTQKDFEAVNDQLDILHQKFENEVKANEDQAEALHKQPVSAEQVKTLEKVSKAAALETTHNRVKQLYYQSQIVKLKALPQDESTKAQLAITEKMLEEINASSQELDGIQNHTKKITVEAFKRITMGKGSSFKAGNVSFGLLNIQGQDLNQMSPELKSLIEDTLAIAKEYDYLIEAYEDINLGDYTNFEGGEVVANMVDAAKEKERDTVSAQHLPTTGLFPTPPKLIDELEILNKLERAQQILNQIYPPENTSEIDQRFRSAFDRKIQPFLKKETYERADLLALEELLDRLSEKQKEKQANPQPISRPVI